MQLAPLLGSLRPSQYCDEVERIFETYKGACPGYENKKFYID